MDHHLVAAYLKQSEMEAPELTHEQWNFVLGLAHFLTVQGVKVGGTYRHFKGTLYKVLGILRDSEDFNGESRVRYVALTNVNHEVVRPIKMFLETVERDGYKGPRFALVS